MPRPWCHASVRARTDAAIAACIAIVACGRDTDRSWNALPEPATLRGTGATVPKALFAKWSEQYALVEPTTKLTYDAEGSGAGVKGAEDASADFGVSDSPLSDTEAAKTGASVLHLPVAVEAIALVYALQGSPAGHLQVTEDVVADMLSGNVHWWDDKALAELNPGVKLPHTTVRVVYRADESGSSFVLTEWLSKTSSRWGRPPSRSLSLPAGVGAQKDDGMVARLRANDGTVGYVSAVSANEQHLSTFAVRNQAGRFVVPSLEGMRAAASTAQLGPDLRAHATAGFGELAYPLCSFTFVLVQRDGQDAGKRRALARFLWWATHDGQKFAAALGFGSLPGELGVRDEAVVRSLQAAGAPAL